MKKEVKFGVEKISQDQFMQLVKGAIATITIGGSAAFETEDEEIFYMKETICNAIAATEQAMNKLNIEVDYMR